MLGQEAEDTIPELAIIHKEFFDKLKAARTRMQLDLAIAAYKRGLDDLVARGIIIESHWRTLRLVIPMRADYVWAKITGEINGKSIAQWASETGYVEEAARGYWKYWDREVAGFVKALPEAMQEVVQERIKEIAGIAELKIPKWAWGLLGLGVLGIVALFATGYALRGIGSE